MLALPVQLALESAPHREVVVVETTPPRAPFGFTPVWGQLRVVRVRDLSGGRLELTVARELLREEKNAPAL